MTQSQFKEVIGEIYPGVDALYVIVFIPVILQAACALATFKNPSIDASY